MALKHQFKLYSSNNTGFDWKKKKNYKMVTLTFLPFKPFFKQMRPVIIINDYKVSGDFFYVVIYLLLMYYDKIWWTQMSFVVYRNPLLRQCVFVHRWWSTCTQMEWRSDTQSLWIRKRTSDQLCGTPTTIRLCPTCTTGPGFLTAPS